MRNILLEQCHPPYGSYVACKIYIDIYMVFYNKIFLDHFDVKILRKPCYKLYIPISLYLQKS